MDKRKLGNIPDGLVRRSFEKNVIDEAVTLGYIQFYTKEGKHLCRLTKDGYGVLFSDEQFLTQNKSDYRNLIIAILALIITILSVVITYLTLIKP